MVSPVVILIALGAGVVALTKVGSLTQAFGFSGSDLVGENQQDQSGEVTTPREQNNPTIPIPEGSQVTVGNIQAQQILRTDIVSKQKLNQTNSKPTIQTVFNNKQDNQSGFVVTSNSSLKNTVLGLNAKQVKQIRAQPFTKQEQQDIINLTARFNRKSTSSQKVSSSPQEIIFRKREQEAIARSIIGGSNFVTSSGGVTRGGSIILSKGGLFGKSNFALGGKTLAEFSEQQSQKALINKKQAENKILNEQRERTGNQILSTIQKSGMNQKQFLLSAGIALRGQNLNAKAIAKLRERGLI